MWGANHEADTPPRPTCSISPHTLKSGRRLQHVLSRFPARLLAVVLADAINAKVTIRLVLSDHQGPHHHRPTNSEALEAQLDLHHAGAALQMPPSVLAVLAQLVLHHLVLKLSKLINVEMGGHPLRRLLKVLVRQFQALYHCPTGLTFLSFTFDADIRSTGLVFAEHLIMVNIHVTIFSLLQLHFDVLRLDNNVSSHHDRLFSLIFNHNLFPRWLCLAQPLLGHHPEQGQSVHL